MSLRRLLLFIANLTLVLVFLLHTLGSVKIPLIDALERFTYDMRLRASMPATVDDRIVIADIDEKSLTDLGRWPWGRHILAEMVNVLFDHYEIKAIGFDSVFAEDDQSSGLPLLSQLAEGELKNDPAYQASYQQLKSALQYDQRFADAIKNRPVVLGHVFNQQESREINHLPDSIAELPTSIQGQLQLPQPQGYSANLPMLQDSAAAGGFFDNPLVSEDGIFRKAPVLQEYKGQLYESLALSLTRLALDNPPFNMDIQNEQGYLAIESIQLGNLSIPVDQQGAVMVPYRGPMFSFPYFSITDILMENIPKDDLKDRIVLLGTTAPGLLDLRSTPVQKAYPGVEVHANIISGMLDQRIKKRPAYILVVDLFLMLLSAVLMIFIAAKLSPAYSIIFTLSLSAAVIWGNMAVWNADLVLPLAPILALITALFMLQMSYGFLIESRAKRSVTKLFGQYVPPALVDEMAANPQMISLEGQDKEMTVLFMDIRGFTSISESLDAKELSRLINRFLTTMTTVIYDHRGTVDKYMGDAIMAFWGAPLDDKHHAKNALHAAEKMLKVLEELQGEFKRNNWPPIKIGVGLNTGIMSVGNMGSEYRMAYTAMGDAVNLGSRLEGLTKEYGVSTIVSAHTKDAAPSFTYRELDHVRVKGKDEPVIIYEPIAKTSHLNEKEIQQIALFNDAIKFYQQGKMDIAEPLFKQLKQNDYWQNSRIYELYLERIHYFRQHPPEQDWDGVFTHTSK